MHSKQTNKYWHEHISKKRNIPIQTQFPQRCLSFWSKANRICFLKGKKNWDGVKKGTLLIYSIAQKTRRLKSWELKVAGCLHGPGRGNASGGTEATNATMVSPHTSKPLQIFCRRTQPSLQSVQSLLVSPASSCSPEQEVDGAVFCPPRSC